MTFIIDDNLKVSAIIAASANSIGTDGQVLASNGSVIYWTDTAGDVPGAKLFIGLIRQVMYQVQMVKYSFIIMNNYKLIQHFIGIMQIIHLKFLVMLLFPII
jgi:hypothetical protein